ncbi:MAG: amino acid ABC transporter substrate-binding protein [Anaerolineae bacterium]|nr:amino acid ABC transporter substrate-binding protein [Anaerolineae bacterium]
MNIWRKRSAANKLKIKDLRLKIAQAANLQSLFFILFFLTACNSVDPVVKVGLVAPFEGENRAIGYDAIYAARLAVRQINEAGGIGGHRVALVALDDSSDTDLAQETAAALVLDPGVMAVIGHGLPQTTAVAAPIYRQANLALIPLGQSPFLAVPPDSLPPEFRTAYEAVTPFDETAGEYAAATYDAFQLLWQALEITEQTEGNITREGVQTALNSLEYQGLTGKVFIP